MYSNRATFAGLTPMLELVLESAAAAADKTGVGIGIIVAANSPRSTRWTLARWPGWRPGTPGRA